MKTSQKQFDFSKSLLALAVIAVCMPAFADEDEAMQLSKPQSSVSVGAGAVDGNAKGRSLFGQYNGLRKDNSALILDADINKRDDASGTALYLKGRNLGLDNRDLSFSYEKQGDWKVGVDYSELVHREIRTVNTGLQGTGTATPSVNLLATPGSGTDLDMSIKRVGTGLALEKWISPRLQFEVSFKNEDKTGARLSGRGYACAVYVCDSAALTATGSPPTYASHQTSSNQTWALLMLPEPVNSNTQQIEAKLNFHNDKLNVSGGYYGSFYTNNFGSYSATVPNQLNSPTGGLSTLAAAQATTLGAGMSLQNVLQAPFALPPDNQAHQFYVSGNYRFTPTTIGTFKYAYTHAMQNENFASAGLTGAPAGVTNLGGVLDNTLVQLGLTAKPVPKLSLAANVKYEDRQDNTPKALYNVEASQTSTNPAAKTFANVYWYNGSTSAKKVAGKFDASYQLPEGYRATVGLDYNSLERQVPTDITVDQVAGLGALRAKNQETGYRLELRRSMSETLTGAVGYTNSKRTGSDWTSLNAATYGQTFSASQLLAVSATNAFPMNMVDINREKFKVSANWTPSERVEVSLNVEDGYDKNATASDPIAGQKGWLGNKNALVGVDVSYAVSDNWKLNGYVAQGNQNLKVNHSTGYLLDLTTRSNSVGFGVDGKATSRLQLGARFTYLLDDSKYGIAASPSATGAAPSATNLAQAAIGLPNVSYESAILNLYGRYELDKSASIQVNLTHMHATLKEWSWSNNGVPFTFSDNTTVGLNPDQSVTYIGAAYVYKFY